MIDILAADAARWALVADILADDLTHVTREYAGHSENNYPSLFVYDIHCEKEIDDV